MALPMDEQRILEEMERMLAADDPRLAARLAAFGQPGVGQVLRTRRARAVLSLLMLAVIGCVAAVIYMVSAFRLAATPVPHTHHSTPISSVASGRTSRPATQVTSTPRCAVVIPSQCTPWSARKLAVSTQSVTKQSVTKPAAKSGSASTPAAKSTSQP